MSYHMKFHEYIATDSLFLDLLLVLQPRNPLPPSHNGLVGAGWVWFEQNVGVVKILRMHFVRDYIFGPPNHQYVPTPMSDDDL